MSKVVYVMVAGLLFGNILATGLLSYISYSNYPGGVAFARLHQIVEKSRGEFDVHQY